MPRCLVPPSILYGMALALVPARPPIRALRREPAHAGSWGWHQGRRCTASTLLRRVLEGSRGIEALVGDGVRLGRPLIDLHRHLVVALAGADFHIAHLGFGIGQRLTLGAARRG